MRKTFGLLALVLIMVFSLAACGGSSSSSSNGGGSSSGGSGESTDSGGSSSGGSSEGSSEDTGSSGGGSGDFVPVTLSTGTTSGVYYPLGAQLAKFWSQAGLEASSQASDGSVQNLNLLQQGKITAALTTIGVLYNAYNGKGKFEGRAFKDVRAITTTYPNVGQIVARAGTGIKTVSDLKGHKFVPGAPGSSTRVLSKHILEAYGLTFKDVKPQFVGFTQAADLMRNKQIDATVMMAGIPTSGIVQVMTTADGQFIPVDEAHIKKMQEKYPWISGFTIPAGTYDGQDQDVLQPAQANVLVVKKSMPEEEVYKLTKVMWENIDKIRKSVAATKNMKLKSATTGLSGIPLHPGAKKYYKEKGVLNK
ncbi:MAG TPA: TAXI family TRAP transporter solute-binding subunit [Bacillales bacterium]